ncbi:MAG: hypothetical protein KF713_10360 [Turneriella sp.]|nr:hypothetical protein [Turneriella sp.]
MKLMQHSNEGRLIDFAAAMNKITTTGQTRLAAQVSHSGKALLMEPRSVRHQERVEDLFYLLFKRTGA